MSIFFRPYEGTRPFLFISYAHKQSEAVVDTIRILHEKGYRLWYDEGIPAGSDWPANIAQHMQGCEKVVFFLSERAMESPNCFSEIRTAFRAGKPILVVRLENVEVTNPDWQELLAGKQVIPLLESPEERA
ncbi:MAG: toll/interleukin-1 receptor domain-containing protein, partial [Stomatobaculum sp.]|nr:toll/interleukin-1 receptor domain-containing protein [Stomatobaculum sp.]